MNQQVGFPSFVSFLVSCVLAVTMSACGGSDKNAPVSVGKSVASYDISGTVDSQRQAFFAVGTEVTSVKCYPRMKQSPGMVTEDRIPAVLYVYQVRARDLDAATTLGFKADFSTTGFSQTERACATDADSPANDIPANDTPANPG
jgi:hypothetical protein